MMRAPRNIWRTTRPTRAEAPARIAGGAPRSRQRATAKAAIAAATAQAMARWANWMATWKLHAAGSRPPAGVDQGKVGIARPAKLWRTTAPRSEERRVGKEC